MIEYIQAFFTGPKSDQHLIQSATLLSAAICLPMRWYFFSWYSRKYYNKIYNMPSALEEATNQDFHPKDPPENEPDETVYEDRITISATDDTCRPPEAGFFSIIKFILKHMWPQYLSQLAIFMLFAPIFLLGAPYLDGLPLFFYIFAVFSACILAITISDLRCFLKFQATNPPHPPS